MLFQFALEFHGILELTVKEPQDKLSAIKNREQIRRI